MYKEAFRLVHAGNSISQKEMRTANYEDPEFGDLWSSALGTFGRSENYSRPFSEMHIRHISLLFGCLPSAWITPNSVDLVRTTHTRLNIIEEGGKKHRSGRRMQKPLYYSRTRKLELDLEERERERKLESRIYIDISKGKIGISQWNFCFWNLVVQHRRYSQRWCCFHMFPNCASHVSQKE